MILTPKLLTLGLLSLAGASIAVQDTAEVWNQKQLEEATAGIQAQIETLRGQKFNSPVTVKVTGEKGLIAYAKERLEATESKASLHADEMTMKQLGLLAADRNYLEETFALLEGQVGGFYDPGSDTFYLMDRFTGGIARIILAHELTHALDDQLFDIDGVAESIEQSTDSELAFHAVVEGSGLGTMYAWMKAHPSEWNMNDLVDMQSLTSGLDDAPAAVWKPLLASYWLGGAFLSKTDDWVAVQMSMKVPGVPEVAAAFKNPPRSTEQILHPEKYWDEATLDEPIAVKLKVSTLLEGWKAVAEDTLGELFLALVTTPAKEREGMDPNDPAAMLKIKFTNEAVTGWGGDRMVLLESDSGSILHLVTVWDTLEDAVQFEGALNTVLLDIEEMKSKGLSGGGLNIERVDDLVLLTSYAGVGAEELNKLVGAVSYSVARPALADDK